MILVLIVFIVVLGVMASTISEHLTKMPRNKYDVIEDELFRLHNELSQYDSPNVEIMAEISKLNNSLIENHD